MLTAARLPLKRIHASLIHCAAGNAGAGAQRAIELLAQEGAEFLSPFTLAPHARPADEIRPDGDIIGSLWVLHPDLEPDVTMLVLRDAGRVPADGPGWASFGYFHGTRQVYLGQDASFRREELVDVLAHRLLAFATRLCAVFAPHFAFVDEVGGPELSGEWQDPETRPCLAWANYFGPPLADEIGRAFLAAAPAWRVDPRPDGGVLLVCTESFREWRAAGVSPVVQYFAARFPSVCQYRGGPQDY